MEPKGWERLSLILRASLPAMLRIARRAGREVFRKPIIYAILVLLIFGVFFSTFSLIPPTRTAHAASGTFTDDFSSSSSNWTPNSGGWVTEGGKYQQKEVGRSYSTQGVTAMNDDFSTPAATITTTGTPFSDSFTEPDGPASQWSVKRPTLAISSNEYLASAAGSATLSIPSDGAFTNWDNYRISAKIKREGAADAPGYSLLYFRLTMVDATKDNSYYLLYRQTGIMELYKRVNGAISGGVLGSFSVSKDNIFHDVIVTVIGSTIKVWLDKTETQVPDMVVVNTSYATGTIGVGTNTWASRFDNIQVDTLQVSSTRWSEKRGVFYTSGEEYYGFSSTASYLLSIPTDASFINWDNYKVSAKIKREGAADAPGYSMLYFRLTMANATNDNSYVLLFRQTGYLELWKRVNGAYSGNYISRITVPKDNFFHDIIVTAVGSTIKVWFDKTDDQFPDMVIGDSSYLTGTVGVGTTSWNSRFDDIIVNQVMTIEPKPSHLYSDSTTNLTFTTGSNLDNLHLTATNPTGASWNLSDPAGCAGNKTCTVAFPTAFTGANLNTLGTYKISATNGDDAASVLLEVKEEPILSFIDIADMHTKDLGTAELNDLNNFISDTNNDYFFPTPNFIVLNGDLTESGTASQLSAIKSSLDTLSTPYYPIPAGHDNQWEGGGDKGHTWANTFGMDKFTYSWTIGNYLFLAMDVEQTYSGYGYDLNSAEHKTWLQNILTANPDKKVFLFSHFGLNAVRDGGDAINHWQGEVKSPEVRSILESQGNVIAQFSGHSHINGMSNLNGIHYFQTGGFVNMDEYRYIEVYSDHIESNVLKKRDYRYGTPAAYWAGSTDSTHNVSLYSYGLPDERQFKIDYATKNLNVLDGISTAGSGNWRDYNYQVDINLGKEDFLGENVGGTVFRYVDTNNYYSAVLDSTNDVIKLQKKQSGSITDLVSQPATIDQNTTYQLKTITQGNSIKIYLNDVLKIDATDSTFSSGKIGLRTYTAEASYDNVSVAYTYPDIPPAQPTPTPTPPNSTIPTAAEIIQTVRYYANAPYAYFVAPMQATSDSAVTFDASDSFSTKGIVSYLWDFGDGTTSGEMRVDHQYQSPGRYTVTLTVTDKSGKTSTKVQTVDVSPPKPTVENIKVDGDDLVFEGEAYPLTKVYLDIHSNPLSVDTKSGNGGDWSYTVANARETLGAGDHTVVASDAFVLGDNTELKSDPSKTYDFQLSLDGDKLKIEMKKTKTWQYISLGLALALVIIIGLILAIRRKK